MKNKIRLKEDELRQIIRESVHSQLINEANPLKNWWNKFTNRFNNRNNYDEYDDDEYDDYDEDTGNDNENDDIDWDGGDSNYEEPDEVKIPQYENPEKFNAGGGGQPFYYGGEPGEPSRVDLQGNGQPHGKETSWNNGGWANAQPAGVASGNGINGEGNGNVNGGEQQPQQQQGASQTQNSQGYNTNQQQQATQQQQQQAYRRGAKYHVAFSKENEDMFENHIKPTYNNLNGVIKSLTALRQIGEHNYNQASSIFGEWGQQNYNGGQPAFKAVCQQIDSIMPTLNNLKKEMKSVLMANGVRDSEDYQHYNMEEQVLRRIVNNSIQKVLSECIKK